MHCFLVPDLRKYHLCLLKMAVVVFTSVPPLYQADDVAAYSEYVDRLYHERILRLSDAFPAPLILQIKVAGPSPFLTCIGCMC